MSGKAPINIQTQRAASLSQAAESLARAAAKLSEAARAMSLVAGALSQENLAKNSGINGSGQSIDSDRAGPTISDDSTAKEDEGVGLPQPYRLLLDDEADILLVLCSLIYDRPKVVCYFTCGPHSLKLYKALIDGVTATNPIIADPYNKLSIDSCFNRFLKAARSILLLSEADVPSALAKEASDYTVIHVGWPVSRRQYVAQRRAHHASTNLLLGYSGDKDLYSSGSGIMSQTVEWPGDTGGFRASVDILRPLFEEKLSEVSFELKEEVYADWIHLHSRQGPRSVSSWTPSALVSRANRFILGPLGYRSPGSLAQKSTFKTPLVDLLPEVSMEFVTEHGLQPAVDKGLLRVETDAEVDDTYETGNGANSAYRLSSEVTKPHIMPEFPVSYTPQSKSFVEGYDSSDKDDPNPPFERSYEFPSDFELATGHSYFALDEEFNSIPLICLLSSSSEKTIVFLEGAMLKKYRKLFRQIMNQKVFTIKHNGSPNQVRATSLRFAGEASPTVLLMDQATNVLPSVLRQYPPGCCIYWAHDIQLEQVKQHQAQISCASIHLIISSNRRDKLIAGLAGFKEHPQSSLILDNDNDSLLESVRNVVRSTLRSGGKTVRSLYTVRIMSLRGGGHKAQEAVRLANLYAARVLLHGNKEDGSKIFPPIRGEAFLDSGGSQEFEFAASGGYGATVFEAAATLATAARATAEALSKEMPRPGSPEDVHGINLGRGSDAAPESVSSNEGDANQRQDLDIDIGDVDRGGEPRTDEVESRPMDTGITAQDPGQSKPMNSSHRLLVESEADVLLFVCALIDKRHKVVCYMPCGTPPLKAYKQLLENVTESPIYILNSSESFNRDQAYNDFVESAGAVLLVPESLLPRFEVEGENSWVIHVGWPASESQYTSQRKIHQAQNNIVVAFSADQSLYPSGNSIVKLTEPWAKDGASFRASVSILRPLYEAMLSEVSLEMKSQVYMDWIQFHGIHGPRHVKQWSPVTVVQRANDYLMKVLLWSGEHTGGEDIPLPEVSPGFVTQNGLQLAVEAGVLRVEDEQPELSQPSPSPVLRYADVLTRDGDERWDAWKFKLTTGHTYFIIEEDFDAIPLMCFIAGKYDKVILFLEGQGALRPYHDLFGRIAGRTIFFPKILNDYQAVEEAAGRFLAAASPAILLLAYTTTNLPPVLNEVSIGCCIYWGFSVPLKQAKKNRALINCTTTINILTTAQKKGITFPKDIIRHPSAAIPLDLTDNSTLAPMRSKTTSILASAKNKPIIDALYTSRVYSVGTIPRNSLSAEEVARRVNQYAARILLHGDIADGSHVFPPVAGRPVVPRTTVERFGLHSAVHAGLLTIGN
ncbi:hypothetical protein OPQ81_002589 [Rhizoctonia solani]|nr:hypothetical protein OPQ81_002589 [Rhizoctonia solani]